MSDLFKNHIVGFSTRRLKYSNSNTLNEKLNSCTIWPILDGRANVTIFTQQSEILLKYTMHMYKKKNIQRSHINFVNLKMRAVQGQLTQ